MIPSPYSRSPPHCGYRQANSTNRCYPFHHPGISPAVCSMLAGSVKVNCSTVGKNNIVNAPKVWIPRRSCLQGYVSGKGIRSHYPNSEGRTIRSQCKDRSPSVCHQSVMSPVVAVAAKVPVTDPCNAKAASLVIAVLPAAVRITFASASKVSKVMPAVATSFKVTLPVADKFELSVMPPVVAVAAKVPVTAPCNAKAASLVIAVLPAAVGSHSRPLLKCPG